MKTYTLDNNQSQLLWKGIDEKTNIQGSIEFNSGKFFLELDEIAGGLVNIDMNSIEPVNNFGISDLEKSKLTAHLKSETFLDVKKYPEAVYIIKCIDPGDTNVNIEGIMILKDKAANINFSCNVLVDEQMISAQGTFILNEVCPAALELVNSEYNGDSIIKVEVSFSIVAYPGYD